MTVKARKKISRVKHSAGVEATAPPTEVEPGLLLANSPPRCFPGRVIFDHLPKTAGQAVNAWLRAALGSGCVSDNLIGAHRELITQYGGAYSVISAHVHFDGSGFDPRYNYVTCFREPIDRALSWIFFVLNNHSDQDIVVLRRATQAFVDSEGEVGQELQPCNEVTNHLCVSVVTEPL